MIVLFYILGIITFFGIPVIQYNLLVGVVMVCVGLIGCAIIYKHENENSKNSSMKTTKMDLKTRSELWNIEQMYKHGDLTFMQYDALRAKYTGDQMLHQKLGMSASEAMATGRAIDAENAYNRQIEHAQKRVAYSAGIGAGLGGLGGELYAGGNAALDEASKTAQALYNRERAYENLGATYRGYY